MRSRPPESAPHRDRGRPRHAGRRDKARRRLEDARPRAADRRQQCRLRHCSATPPRSTRDEQLEMIDLNARALTDLSLRFADSLARHRGGILNVARSPAFSPAANMAVYARDARPMCSRSQRGAASRVAPHGVRVTVLCPARSTPASWRGRESRKAISRVFSTARPSASRVRATTASCAATACVVPGFINKR